MQTLQCCVRRWACLRRLLACAGLVLVVACGDPCRELSDSICRCAPTRAEEQRCLRHVRSLAGQKAHPADAAAQARCQALQASCSCDALAAGDLAACGLTQAAF